MTRVPAESTVTIGYIPTSHLDLFWLGNYKSCLARGVEVIRQYVDRCLETKDETFLLETAVFAEEFLRRYPEYRQRLVGLVKDGRVEVGAAYIDRWEHRPLGESHIRNLVLGKRWYQEVFGQDNKLATHPDLPSFVPQTPQIYARAGVKYYATTRKLFPDGAIWRFRAPDESFITVLHYPVHYTYLPMDKDEVPSTGSDHQVLDLVESLQMFPLGVVPVSGGAGDLSDRETFRSTYGKYLDELVADHRDRYKELLFTYTTPSRVLGQYDMYEPMPELRGEVPSVWGIGIPNGSNVYAAERLVEASLLTAEMLAGIAEGQGLDWRPDGSSSWQGVYYESAYFDRKDPIERGREFSEIWKMHVFCQDHNAGGEEATLSEFQKQVREQRCSTYSEEVITTVLGQFTGVGEGSAGSLVVFNPHPYDWADPVALEIPSDVDLDKLHISVGSGSERSHVPWQLDESTGDTWRINVRPPSVPPIGYRVCDIEETAENGERYANTGVSVVKGKDGTTLDDGVLRLTVSNATGNLVELADLVRGVDWGGDHLGRIYGLKECGTDAALVISEAPGEVEAKVVSSEVVAIGPLFARLRVVKDLRGCAVQQWYTLWAGSGRVDCRTEIRWDGARNWHVRQGLPTATHPRDVVYGSPFFASRWTDIMPGAGPETPMRLLPKSMVTTGSCRVGCTSSGLQPG